MNEKLSAPIRIALITAGIILTIFICFVLKSRIGVIFLAPVIAGISGVCPCAKAARFMKKGREKPY